MIISVLQLFNLNYYKKDYDRAIADYTQVIRINPNDAYVAYCYNNRGVAYENKGDTDKAAADYTQASRLAPSNQEVKNNLARATQPAPGTASAQAEAVAHYNQGHEWEVRYRGKAGYTYAEIG